MARDSAVGRERVLIVPGNLTLENAANQLADAAQSDINQQILEVRSLAHSILLFLQNLKYARRTRIQWIHSDAES